MDSKAKMTMRMPPPARMTSTASILLALPFQPRHSHSIEEGNYPKQDNDDATNLPDAKQNIDKAHHPISFIALYTTPITKIAARIENMSTYPVAMPSRFIICLQSPS
jgi:hypothetical protein